MPEIPHDVESFILSKNATMCSPLPAKGPQQRGPSCGFYAVGHVMQYWHLKLENTSSRVPVPLPARTNMTGPKPEQYTPPQREHRDATAKTGTFTSLRQVGKFHRVTAYGSVFNAENLVKVARLGGVGGHEGTYDGHVVTTAKQDDYIEKVKALISRECPVIVPFDVNDDGDPYVRHGKAAHWGVIFGWYSEASDLYFIHYHWGAYRYSPARAFAESTQSLTANAFLIMNKMELIDPDTSSVVDRGHFGVRYLPGYRSAGWQMRSLGEPKANVEFTNPRTLDTPFPLDESNDLLREHGFDPTNLRNAGLKDKLVAIYPAARKPALSTI